MADLNDPNKPTVTDLYADVIDTLRENTKRATSNSYPLAGGAVAGPVYAPGFYHQPGNYPVWHAGSFDPTAYMPKIGGTFTGPIVLSAWASAGPHPVPLSQLQSFSYIQEAPVNSVYYGRRNGAWEPVAPRTVDDALIGSIMARPVWGGAIEPAWIECSGQVLNKATYARLWNWVANVAGLWAANDTDWNNFNWGRFLNIDATSFRIPYLMGQFVRAHNPTGSGWDIGRSLGAAQTDSFAAHAHPVGDPGHAHVVDGQFHDGLTTSSPSIATQSGDGYSIPPGIHPTSTGLSSSNVFIHEQGGTETRPINVAYRHFIYAGNPLA